MRGFVSRDTLMCRFRLTGYAGWFYEEMGNRRMADQALVTAHLLPERLVVIEQEGNFVVVNDDDPSDWVACFSPDERFPAR